MKQSKLYPWMVVALLWVVALLNYLDRQMLSTMKPAMMADIPELTSAVNFGYFMGIFLWVYGAVSSFAGVLGDVPSFLCDSAWSARPFSALPKTLLTISFTVMV